jgi:hypothetical protein
LWHFHFFLFFFFLHTTNKIIKPPKLDPKCHSLLFLRSKKKNWFIFQTELLVACLINLFEVFFEIFRQNSLFLVFKRFPVGFSSLKRIFDYRKVTKLLSSKLHTPIVKKKKKFPKCFFFFEFDETFSVFFFATWSILLN